MPSITVPLPAIPPGRSVVVEMGDRSIMLCRSASGLHASNGFCPHQRKLLADGRVRGGILMCIHHGARFDLATGRSLSPQLTPLPLQLYRVREHDGLVEIEIDD
jgi:nitrite reductase/ring-hydroxylating ferredoxin subunit